jgi:spore germination cell wall hydrolase CwlJ-like protein
MAVGQVVLNRLKSPNYPKTVCGVVHQKTGDTCMFSWLCEGPKEVKNSLNWQQSQQIAYKLLSREIDDLTEGSTNFHGIGVNPKWNLKPTVKIDGHQFYR